MVDEALPRGHHACMNTSTARFHQPQVHVNLSQQHIAGALAQYYQGQARRKEPTFSLASMFRAMANEEFREGGSYEADVCRAASRAANGYFDPRNPIVPFDALLSRDLSVMVGGPSAGGFIVGTQPQSPMEPLRDWSLVGRMGCTMLTGLQQNVTIPTTTTVPTVSWLANELSTAPQSDPVMGQVAGAPKHASFAVRLSRTLLKAGGTVAETYVNTQIRAALGTAVDTAVLAGSGVSGQPVGLSNVSGVTTSSGAVSLATLLDSQQALAAAKADDESIACVTTPAVRRILAAREVVTNTGRMLWTGRPPLLADKPAFASNLVPAGTIFTCDWSRVVVGVWGEGVELQVDPYTDFKTGAVNVRGRIAMDVLFPLLGALHRHTSAS